MVWGGVLRLLAAVGLVVTMSPVAAEPIRGAGSSFAAPIITTWGKLYERLRADGGDFVSPEWKLDYEPVGSLAGVMRLGQSEMDFAATDAPLPADEVARRGYSQFPIVIGGVAIVANLTGIATGTLNLDGETLANIYLGKIKRWDDAALKALNPSLALPAQDIRVIRRADGSGTTLAFAQFLSQGSAEWKTTVGADTELKWPTGEAARGSGGVAAAMRAPGAIAYLEYGQAQRSGLPLVRVKNAGGAFVAPDPVTIAEAVSGLRLDAGQHFFANLAEVGNTAGYPIVAATYAVIPPAIGSARLQKVTGLFQTAFRDGANDAKALGFVPLPSATIDTVTAYWAKQRLTH
jgi:phosphate transport system substrate-binding protein